MTEITTNYDFLFFILWEWAGKSRGRFWLDRKARKVSKKKKKPWQAYGSIRSLLDEMAVYQNNVEVHDHEYSGSLKIQKNDKQVFFKSVNKLEKVSQKEEKVNVIISMHTGMGCMHARTLPNTTTTTTTSTTK